MTTVTVAELQQDLFEYLRRVSAGETLVVTENGKPLAELKPPKPPASGPRPFGLAAGLFEVPDDFDAPLPDEALRSFEGQ